MKVVSALLHVAVDDDADPLDVAKQLAGGRRGQVSFLTERPLLATADVEIEIGVSAHLFQVGSYCRRDEEAVHRQVLMDLAQPDPTRSARRWARIKQLNQMWRDGWEPQTGGKKRPKGQPSFHETDDGIEIAATSGWLHDLERHTAAMLDWPVWQQGQHCEVLDEQGVLWDAEVLSFDTYARTVDVRMWAHRDVMGTIKTGEGVFRTVTIDQIEAGKAEEERLDEIRRQAIRDAPPEPKPAKKAKKTPAPANAAPQDDLFSSIPTVE